MNTRTAFTSAILLVTALAAGVFFWTAVRALLYAPESEVVAPRLGADAPSTAVASTSLPVRLIIPAIHINASVQQVGVTVAGNMSTPNNFTDVAWYKYGTVPGQTGSAVIDGHVDNGLGLDGVFKHLGDIKIGDDIYVEQAGGSRLHFVVTDIEAYPYQNVPAGLVFGRTDAARLNLITCEGIWVPSHTTYDRRLVVYAKLANSIETSGP